MFGYITEAQNLKKIHSCIIQNYLKYSHCILSIRVCSIPWTDSRGRLSLCEVAAA